jgi:hypothetical protein
MCIAEFKDKNRRAEGAADSVRLKAPAYAEATAGRPAYGITQPSAGRQSFRKVHNALLAGKVRCQGHNME